MTASASVRSSRSTRMPSWPTGMPTTSSPARPGGRAGVVLGGRVLDRQPPRARACEQLHEQRDALRVAVADHHVLGPDRGASHSVEVAGERLVQLRDPAPAQVAEPLVRSLGEHPADRAQPRRPGKLGNIRAAVPEVDPQRRCRVGCLRRRLGLGADGDPGVPALPAGEASLGQELPACDAVLMGRRTYEGFAPVWQRRSGDPYSSTGSTA
jgi:hypothetical protein